jgi:hypothetical protein
LAPESSPGIEESQRRLEVESVDLGPDVRAVGLELINPDDREPIVGGDAAEIWAALLPVLAGGEPFALDFFAHIDRVRDFCGQHSIQFRESGSRALIVPQPPGEQLRVLFERFAGETFGARAGAPVLSGDTELEGDLAARGVDAYHPAYSRYLFCAVCDFEGGFLTMLSQGLWASEIMRRARAALEGLRVEVARPA